jgi:hypothetical protein
MCARSTHRTSTHAGPLVCPLHPDLPSIGADRREIIDASGHAGRVAPSRPTTARDQENRHANQHNRRPLQLRCVVSTESRRVAGILLIIMPTVVIGGVSILSLLIGNPAYSGNPLRQDLWRAGHAHAGVLLVFSLVVLRYVDEAQLGERSRRFVRLGFPTAAVLLPLAFFLSVLSPDAQEPNALIYLAYVGAVVLVVAMIMLGIGMIRTGVEDARPADSTPAPH